MTSPLRTAALIAAGSAALAGCSTYDGYYGGMSLGYGGYYDDYYGYPYYGWYDNYYYPGIGYYVYDRGGRRHSWNDTQRRYWEGRRSQADARRYRENWSGFRSSAGTGSAQTWRQRSQDGATWRSGRGEAWRSQQMQSGAATTGQAPQGRWGGHGRHRGD